MVGNLKTRRWVIDRELTFNEGEPISTSKFQESRRNLYDLGIFRTADVRVAPSEPGTEIRDVIVRVVERELLDMSYGLRYNFVSPDRRVCGCRPRISIPGTGRHSQGDLSQSVRAQRYPGPNRHH